MPGGPTSRRRSSGTRTREPMSYVPPGRDHEVRAGGAQRRDDQQPDQKADCQQIPSHELTIVDFRPWPQAISRSMSSHNSTARSWSTRSTRRCGKSTPAIDLKDSGSSIELETSSVKLHSASEMTLEAVRDVLLQKAVKRQLSPKIFDYGTVEEASKGTVRQTAALRQGLIQDLAREITKLIRDRLPKLKTQIQGDAVRVTGQEQRRAAGGDPAVEEVRTGAQLAGAAAVRQLPLTSDDLVRRRAPAGRCSGRVGPGGLRRAGTGSTRATGGCR